uniref:G-protein coupled receptors family 1 profile domain-containing protein n=1 Tax=Strongyloides stercoralis TaxID=6248 RepID=A0AAF5D1B3_STRER
MSSSLLLLRIQKQFKIFLLFPEVTNFELILHTLILLTTCPIIFYFMIKIVLSWSSSNEYKSSLFKIIVFGKIADVVTSVLYFFIRIIRYHCPLVNLLIYLKIEKQKIAATIFTAIKNLANFFSIIQLTQCCYMTTIRFVTVWFPVNGIFFIETTYNYGIITILLPAFILAILLFENCEGPFQYNWNYMKYNNNRSVLFVNCTYLVKDGYFDKTILLHRYVMYISVSLAIVLIILTYWRMYYMKSSISNCNMNNKREDLKRQFGIRVTIYVFIDILNNIVICTVEQIFISYTDEDPDINQKY